MKFEYATPGQKARGPCKVYGETPGYERKLRRVMERLGARNVNYDWTRQAAWISFAYKGQLYRFDHNTEKTLKTGQKLYFGTDCFAQIVLSLEDIARMVERGIYDLQKWIEGMKALPPGVILPDYLTRMEFTEQPASEEEIHEHYRRLAKKHHPDAGGDPEDFKRLENDKEQAMDWWRSREAAQIDR